MRFLANEEQRRDAVAPEAEIECHAAEHRHDRVDDFGGEAGELHHRHRPVLDRHAEQLAEHHRHGVAADIGRFEHEGVARIVDDAGDALQQLVVRRARGAVLELAHPVVDQRYQIVEAVGHRRVDRIAGINQLAAIRRLSLRVDFLGERNDVGKDLNLVVDRRAADLSSVVCRRSPASRSHRPGDDCTGARSRASSARRTRRRFILTRFASST